MMISEPKLSMVIIGWLLSRYLLKQSGRHRSIVQPHSLENGVTTNLPVNTFVS
jgi:hypothetical protein